MNALHCMGNETMAMCTMCSHIDCILNVDAWIGNIAADTVSITVWFISLIIVNCRKAYVNTLREQRPKGPKENIGMIEDEKHKTTKLKQTNQKCKGKKKYEVK